MAKGPSGFFNERTAEYFLTPLLQRSLEAHFGSAIPMFFWKSREGNRTSLMIHEGRRVRVLAMFARRPKVGLNSDQVTGRIGRELWTFARHASKAGLMTIAALPVVGSIFELYEPDARVLWFPLDQRENEDPFTVDKCKPVGPITLAGHAFKTSTIEELVRSVHAKCGVFQWNEAMELMADLRQAGAGSPSFFGLIGGYKPVYFLIPAD